MQDPAQPAEGLTDREQRVAAREARVQAQRQPPAAAQVPLPDNPAPAPQSPAVAPGGAQVQVEVQQPVMPTQVKLRDGVQLLRDLQVKHKLNDSNYIDWWGEVEHKLKLAYPGIFKEDAVMDVATGQELKDILAIMCEPPFARMVKRAPDGLKAIKAIEAYFLPKLAAQLNLLELQANALRQQEGESLVSYATRALDLWQLMDIIPTNTYTECKAVTAMVNGILPEHGLLQQTLLGKVLTDNPEEAKQVTFASIMQQLSYVDLRKSHQQQQQSSALLMQRSGAGRGGDRGAGTGTSSGVSVSQRAASGGRDKSKAKCFGCKQKGHYIGECPNPELWNAKTRNKMQAIKQKQQQQQPQSQQAAQAGPSKPKARVNVAFMALVAVDKWAWDSGANRHMCSRREDFGPDYVACNEQIRVGNGQTAQAVGKGTVVLQLDEDRSITLLDVLHVPTAPVNVISVEQAVSKGLSVTFTAEGCVMRDSEGEELARGVRREGLFVLEP